ncbi:MAG: histidine kinase dimerization/phosphoacceptor domain-containing protein [bacterium]|jgi:signal transduction histidine kinase|nr:histidine kinase dimerization/phosphoacceptor domain-containing protein [bacterium]
MTPGAQTRTELREHLARELHDGVAGEMQAMLIDMELLRRRGAAPLEIEDFQTTVRRALSGLRGIIRELRDLPPDPALVERAIDRKVARASGRRHRREPPA